MRYRQSKILTHTIAYFGLFSTKFLISLTSKLTWEAYETRGVIVPNKWSFASGLSPRGKSRLWSGSCMVQWMPSLWERGVGLKDGNGIKIEAMVLKEVNWKWF